MSGRNRVLFQKAYTRWTMFVRWNLWYGSGDRCKLLLSQYFRLFYTEIFLPIYARWWTRWEAGDTVVKDRLIEFAMMKLAAQHYGDYTAESFLAAISVRLMLDFEPRGISAIGSENLMVADHLRVANVIPSHREHIISSTPSEPIVAEAAAQVLREQNMIDLLCGYVKNGLIDRGQRGELAARLLLTLAHDAALEVMNVERRDYQGWIERLFTTPIPLLSFISALFAQPHVGNIMDAVPDNQPAEPTFKESFKDAYIMFTHFGKAAAADDDRCISDKFAFMALTRNMAISCRERTRKGSVDLCIPIHFGKENRLSRDTTGAIFISIKDKEKGMGFNHTHINVGKMKFFTDETKQRPVINLILQFGVQSAGRYMPIERTKTQQTPASGLLATPRHKNLGPTGQEVPQTPIGVSMLGAENSDKPNTRAMGTTPGPACYTINANGCSSNIYGVVKREEEPLWHDLLASTYFLSEHSRQGTHSLNTVMAQKPVWTSGPECCSWADLSELPSQGEMPQS